MSNFSYQPAIDFNTQTGEALKDIALQLVLENAGQDFMDRAAAAVPLFLGGQTVLAEEWRILLAANGIRPHHPNAWGALTNALHKRGVISPTDELAKSKDKRSHARRQPKWFVKPLG